MSRVESESIKGNVCMVGWLFGKRERGGQCEFPRFYLCGINKAEENRSKIE